MIAETRSSFAPGKYLAQFVGISVLLALAGMIFSFATGYELPSAYGVISHIAALAAIAPGITTSVARELTKGERASFAAWTSLLSFAVAAATTAGVMSLARLPLNLGGLGALAGGGAIPAGIFLLIVLFALLFSWLLTYFLLGAFVRQHLKRLAKTDQSAAKQ